MRCNVDRQSAQRTSGRTPALCVWGGASLCLGPACSRASCQGLACVLCSPQNYVHAKLRQFGSLVCRRLNQALTKEQVDIVLQQAMQLMVQQDAMAQPPRNLRLVIRHDCQCVGPGGRGGATL